MPEKKLWVRPFLLVFAFGNLIFGMLSGLGRMGWQMPLPELYVHHGSIMVGGFLGSLISLEKVIPLKKPVLLLGPLLSASSIIIFLIGHAQAGVAMLIISSAMLVVVYFNYLKNQRSLYLSLALMGALCWCTGNIMLLWRHFYPMAFPWWMGFILFTIVSERLELAKFLPVTRRNKHLLICLLGLFFLGLFLPFHKTGAYIAGASMSLMAIWLLQNDVIRVGIKKNGLTRFMAMALLAGYCFLLFEGIFLIVLEDVSQSYDVVIHTFFIGFAFAMIFAHGPVILPGVLGLSVKPYSQLLYVPLVVLVSSLVMRITSDLEIIPFHLRAFSGWITFGSIILYFLIMVTTTIRELRNAKTD